MSASPHFSRWMTFVVIAFVSCSTALMNIGCTASKPVATVQLIDSFNPEDRQPPSEESSLLTTVTLASEARRQEVGYLFDTALNEAQKATVTIANLVKPLKDEQINAAKNALTQADVARNLDPSLFTRDELDAFKTRLARATVAAQEAIARRTQFETQRLNRDVHDRIIFEQQYQERQRQRTVEDLSVQLKRLIG